MTDLFTPTPAEDAYQDWLREDWRARNQRESQQQRISGRIIPWQETPDILEADEMKVLTLVDETAGHTYYGGEHDRQLANAIGFKSTGNLNAVMNKLVEKGLIVFRTEPFFSGTDRADRQRICMTAEGRRMFEKTMEETELDMEAMSDIEGDE